MFVNVNFHANTRIHVLIGTRACFEIPDSVAAEQFQLFSKLVNNWIKKIGVVYETRKKINKKTAVYETRK